MLRRHDRLSAAAALFALLLALCTAAGLPSLGIAAPSVPSAAIPETDRADLGETVPRGAVREYLSLARRGDYEAAARFLDLSAIPAGRAGRARPAPRARAAHRPRPHPLDRPRRAQRPAGGARGRRAAAGPRPPRHHSRPRRPRRPAARAGPGGRGRARLARLRVHRQAHPGALHAARLPALRRAPPPRVRGLGRPRHGSLAVDRALSRSRPPPGCSRSSWPG